MDSVPLLITIVLAVVVLAVLIMGLRLHAFVALLAISIITGLIVGIEPAELMEVVEDGMGGVLGFVAIIVGLGAMFSEVLRVTGAGQRIADTIVEAFGEKRVPWSLGASGFIVAIPVFFDVGLVLLMPIVYRLVKRTGAGLVALGLPLLAGLSAAHSLVPPGPGPVAAAGVLGADLGWIIVFGIAGGIPAVIIAGILYGRFLDGRVSLEVPADIAEGDDDAEDREPPSFRLVLTILMVPIVLILLGTLAEMLLEEGHVLAQIAAVVGNPFTALLVAVLLAFYVLAIRSGLSLKDLEPVATKALAPVGMILLVTGAGGVFGEVLQASGVDTTLEEFVSAVGWPLILVAFIAAALFRVALGSATVATVAAASIIAEIAGEQYLSAPLLGAIVVAIGAGSTALSHFNDSGFWLANRYMNMDSRQTLLVWTVMQTILAVVAFVVVFAISLALPSG